MRYRLKRKTFRRCGYKERSTAAAAHFAQICVRTLYVVLLSIPPSIDAAGGRGLNMDELRRSAAAAAAMDRRHTRRHHLEPETETVGCF